MSIRYTISVLILQIFCASCYGGAPKYGPYKSYIIKVNKCEKPTLPLDPNPGTFMYYELYNTSTSIFLLRGNMTIVRDQRNKKINVKGYMWKDDKWKISYIANNMGCRNILISAITMTTGVKYDENTCTATKGVYTFDNIDINKLQHVFVKNHLYGKVMWKVEMFSNAGSVYCWELIDVIEPDIKKVKKSNIIDDKTKA